MNVAMNPAFKLTLRIAGIYALVLGLVIASLYVYLIHKAPSCYWSRGTPKASSRWRSPRTDGK